MPKLSFLQGTYTLIHSFLLKQSHLQVARALKKAAKDVVILKDDIDPEGPPLDVILQEWRRDRAKETAQSSSCVKVFSFTLPFLCIQLDNSDGSDSDSSTFVLFVCCRIPLAKIYQIPMIQAVIPTLTRVSSCRSPIGEFHYRKSVRFQ